MKTRLPRRAVLGLGSMALASCGRREPYFGKSTPPPTQTLVYEIAGEPSSLDPATCLGIGNCEGHVMPALVRGIAVPRPAYARAKSRAGDALSSRRQPDGVHIFSARTPVSDRDEIARRRHSERCGIVE